MADLCQILKNPNGVDIHRLADRYLHCMNQFQFLYINFRLSINLFCSEGKKLCKMGLLDLKKITELKRLKTLLAQEERKAVLQMAQNNCIQMSH